VQKIAVGCDPYLLNCLEVQKNCAWNAYVGPPFATFTHLGHIDERS
jgi:hypothetical protein